MTKSHDASRYREDAARFRQRAADAADDADLRNSYLAAAREFEKLADLLEAKLRPTSAAKSEATRGTWLSMSRLSRRQQSPDTADNLPEPERTTDSNHPCAARMVTVLVIDADPAVRLAVKSVLEPADDREVPVGQGVEVDDCHVGSDGAGVGQGLVDPADLGDDFEVLFVGQNYGKCSAEQLHLLNEQDAYHVVLPERRS